MLKDYTEEEQEGFAFDALPPGKKELHNRGMAQIGPNKQHLAGINGQLAVTFTGRLIFSDGNGRVWNGMTFHTLCARIHETLNGPYYRW